MMIEAIDIVRKRINEPIEIVIAGTDNPNVKGYLADVQKKYNHIPDLVFTGYVAEEDVEKIFRDSAVVVFPYTSTTGSSGVLHQAGSYGNAVALPDLGDLSILVKEEGYRGEFFDADNPESLANAIQNIITNDTYRRSLGHANYTAACSLPMSTITEMYLDNFNQIIDKKAGLPELQKDNA